VGISVLSGAASTSVSGIPLLFSTITFFTLFGVFIIATSLLSFFFSIGLFMSLLFLAGPEGDTGDVTQGSGCFGGGTKKPMAKLPDEVEIELIEGLSKTVPLHSGSPTKHIEVHAKGEGLSKSPLTSPPDSPLNTLQPPTKQRTYTSISNVHFSETPANTTNNNNNNNNNNNTINTNNTTIVNNLTTNDIGASLAATPRTSNHDDVTTGKKV
jgi:hypothetical protein